MPNQTNTGPGYPEGYRLVTTGYGGIINQRVSTGFAKWGFVIYRGVYGNDAEWNAFITILKEGVVECLQFAGQEDELGPDLEWTIIQDRATLEGASKDVVRAQFLEWVAARSVERDGPQADAPWLVEHLPRFRYCIYVDEASFNSITVQQVGKTTQWSLDADSKVVIIDGTPGHSGQEDSADEGDEGDEEEEDEDAEEDEGYAPIEGNTAYDVGWAYVDAFGLTGLYNSLCYAGGDREKWDDVYRGRRPDKHPAPGQSQPLSAVVSQK